MKLKPAAAIIVIGLITLSTLAQESSPPTISSGPPDKIKLSYAVGMRMGLELLHASTNVDVNIAVHAIQDVLEGKPTMIQESEMAPIFNRTRAGKMGEQDKAKFSYAVGMRMALLFKRTGTDMDPKAIDQAIQDMLQGRPKMKESEIAPLFQQAENYETAKTLLSNETAGKAFLAKNAGKPGIHVLRDGLQYQIIKQGTGSFAKPSDLIFIKFHGTFINGVEFDHHPHFLTRTHSAIKGWNDVLPKMRVGSEWRIFVPPNLAFGHEGDSFNGVGPDATVIYDLQLVSIAPPGGTYEVNSGLGHGLDVGVTAPEPPPAKSAK
jgi:FKBP-type peptidyl-prolyl cis-trans isomerase